MKLCPSRRSLFVLLLALLSGAVAYVLVQRRSPHVEATLPPQPTPRDTGAPGPVVVDDVAEEPAAADPVNDEPLEERPVGKHLADVTAAGLDEVPSEEIGDDLAEGLPTGPFGPGSAEPLEDGSAPGAAYTIKGNAGSMLFHTPESPSYARTRAEAWFITEEAAQQAGFTSWRDRATG